MNFLKILYLTFLYLLFFNPTSYQYFLCLLQNLEEFLYLLFFSYEALIDIYPLKSFIYFFILQVHYIVDEFFL